MFVPVWDGNVNLIDVYFVHADQDNVLIAFVILASSSGSARPYAFTSCKGVARVVEGDKTYVDQSRGA